MTKTIWLEIDPVDTLFFRGAESMEAGENHEVGTMFPPIPSTITGAVRTAILKQRGIDPADYLSQPDDWQKKYPFLGTPQKPGFKLLGPLLTAGETLLFPAPASWYTDSNNTKLHSATLSQSSAPVFCSVQAAQPLSQPPLGMCGSVSKPFWIHKPIAGDMQPLAGMWVTGASFSAMRNGQAKLCYTEIPSQLSPDEPAMLPGTALFAGEERVGIALNRQRTTKEGHLYSTVHIRLRDGIRLVAGVQSNNKSCLDPKGILQLGGEQRICQYHTLADITLPATENGQLLYTISPLSFSDLPDELRGCPRASSKLIRVGGWDMQKKFHKPMEAYLPAGTVIACNQPNLNTNIFLKI